MPRKRKAKDIIKSRRYKVRKEKINKLKIDKTKDSVTLDNNKEQRDDLVSNKKPVTNCCIGSMCKFQKESLVYNQRCLKCNGTFHILCAIWNAIDHTWICQKCYNSSKV